MPETLTGWARRIASFCDQHHIYRSNRQIKNLAGAIARRAERMQYVDPDTLIRSALCYADPTGEEAVRNVITGRNTQ